MLALLTLVPSAWARDPIVPLSDMHRGMTCTALTVVQGTAISTFDVEVLDVVTGSAGDPADARILVRVSGPAVAATGVASGFSGSPVLCHDANGQLGNAGAISATIGQYGNDVALVTPIEQMLGLDVTPPTGIRRAPRVLRGARPLLAPLTVSGLSPALGDFVARGARRHGRVVVAAPVGPLATFAVQPLVPGASMAVSLASGDLVAGAVGTVTYRDGDVVYGFGHMLEGAGRRALLLQDAYVFTVIANPLDLGLGEPTAYKLAAPGHVVGTLTSDQRAGVVGIVGDPPPSIPLTVRARDEDRDRGVRLRSEIVDEVGVGMPSGPGIVPLLASLGVAQGVTAAFDGAPANETGRLCLRVRLRELRQPLRFCNRYVVEGFVGFGEPSIATAMADDVAVALGAIDTARFARLHVTSVSASARVERGLRLATIRSVEGPRKVRPGQRIQLKLRVRLVHGPLRTLRVTTRVPRDVPRGVRTLKIVGTPSDGDGFGGGGDGEFFLELFGEGEGAGGAQSLRQVRDRFESVDRWDGVTARIGRRSWRLLRSESVRIDGRGLLDVRVAGRRGARGAGGIGDPSRDVRVGRAG